MDFLDLDFLKSRYDFELDRKEKLTAALTLPVGVLSGLGSLLAVMARSFTYRDPMLTRMFVLGFGASLLTFVACLTLLAGAYLAQTYVYLPLLAQLVKAREEFLEYAKVMAGGEAEVMEAFDDDFRRRIIAAADANTESNDRRSKFLHWARISLFCLLVGTAFSGLPYVIDQVRFVMPTQQVPKPSPTQPASAPQKPSFPENRVIKEGREPQTVVKK